MRAPHRTVKNRVRSSRSGYLTEIDWSGPAARSRRRDPPADLALSLAAGVFVLVALLASVVPARRAAPIDSTRALQSE